MSEVWKSEHQTQLKCRVYYEDTDAGGVVYHARYLHFMERARTEWLREMGVDQVAIRAEQNKVFVVTDSVVKWLKPARLDDLLLVTAKVAKARRATVLFEQSVYRVANGSTETEAQLLATGEFTAACVSCENWKPTRLPQL